MDKAAAKLLASSVLAPPAQNVWPTATPLTRENAAILARLIPNRSSSAETNINNILAGDGLGGNKSSNAVSIRDLVHHLNNNNKNGAGLKLAGFENNL